MRTSSTLSVVGYLWIIALVCLCLQCDSVIAHSSGAPTASCTSMSPDHGGGSTSNDPCPFETVPIQVEMFSNESLTLSIQSKSPSAKLFKGFLIMGFDSVTDVVIGTFRNELSQGQSQSVRCYETYDTAATHRSATGKNSMTIEWIPPIDFDGAVVFKTTFVEAKFTYWIKQLSQQVKITRSDTTITTTIDQQSTTEEPVIPDVYEGCGISKGCAATPGGCVGSRDCSMLTTYKRVDDSHLQLEIYGQISGDEYVAVGFSTDREMGMDSVVECANYRNKLGAFQSYNTVEKSNQRVDPQLPGFIMTLATFSDGFIYCNVLHPINYTMNNVVFDLRQPHYLLMATGPTGDYNILEHDEEESSRSSVVLTNALCIMYFKEASRVLKRLHGSFMVIAWLMAASAGVLMPRYMKKTWIGKQFMKKDLWFVYHQGLMVLAWCLTVAGFIIIFVDVGGWVSESVSENPHPLIGCISTVLAFIQPFMALMRPLPNAPNRYIFNWAHMLVGYSAHILAVTCIFLAVEMEEAELPYETYWILTTHICCYVGAHFLLTYLARRDYNAAEFASKSDGSKDDQGSKLRQGILAGYVCIIIGLGVTVIAFIAGA